MAQDLKTTTKIYSDETVLTPLVEFSSAGDVIVRHSFVDTDKSMFMLETWSPYNFLKCVTESVSTMFLVYPTRQLKELENRMEFDLLENPYGDGYYLVWYDETKTKLNGRQKVVKHATDIFNKEYPILRDIVKAAMEEFKNKYN